MGSDDQAFCRPGVQALREADAFLCDIGAISKVDVLPGRFDPTNVNFPQKAMLPHLFPRARSCANVRLTSNPYQTDIGDIQVLGHAGQPLQDIMRCTQIEDPLDVLQLCLEACHLAPTAPDTLPMAPSTS